MASPIITWIGSPNFWSGRNGQKISVIVDHITEGAIGGVDSFFSTTASEVSAHYCVAKNGEIHQYVNDSDTAWANGILQQPNTNIPFVKACVGNGINPNFGSLSIEHEGTHGVPLTEPQYQASLWLHLRLIRTHGLGYDANSIIAHHDIMSIDRANCPGSAFPWTRLRYDISQALGASHVTEDHSSSTDLTDPKKFLIPGSGIYNFMQSKGCYAVTGERSAHFDDAHNRISVADGVRYVDGKGVRVWYDALTDKCELLIKEA